LGLCLGQTDIADGLQPHAVLERGEGGLDGSPASGDEAIVSLEPRRQLGMVFVWPPYDARFLAFSRARRLCVS
jgi:hypothetical protein